MNCCTYSCTQYALHPQYMLLTHADDLLCLQLHTVQSAYTLHAANPCRWLAVPTAAHSTVCIHSTCFWPMLMTCCAYSCTQYSLHTHYMLLTHADDLLFVTHQWLYCSNSTYCPGRTDSNVIVPLYAFTTMRATWPATCEEFNIRSVHRAWNWMVGTAHSTT